MKPSEEVRANGAWLDHAAVQSVFDLLLDDGGEAMVAGGAVRNALMGVAINDVDFCTTLLPDEVMARCEAAGHKAIPTGIDHGTVTVVVDETAFEVTTLREDIETDGRHAVVQFGKDWEADAKRRDLTINGLYCDREGHVFDFVDGVWDIKSKTVRFIGDADTRIKEDVLRILRFFRFFAWYGGGRPDADGLKACVANREAIQNLSAERIWSELKRLLSAKDPGRALLWMRTTGVLAEILPETAKWGIDAIPGLIRNESVFNWSPDPMLRLMAMVRPHDETVTGLSKRLLLSNLETTRLQEWARSQAPKPTHNQLELDKQLYRGSAQGIVDRMRLEVGHLQDRDDATGADSMVSLLEHAENWRRPDFPVKGKDLLDMGFAPSPSLGEKLAMLEDKWVESGFSLRKDELLGL